jgi:transcriptional regulator with XRE-family HTH domain
MTLKAMREAAGLTQEALASACDMRQGAISQLENGLVANPGIDTAEKLAAALGRSVEDVIAAVRASVAEAAA